MRSSKARRPRPLITMSCVQSVSLPGRRELPEGRRSVLKGGIPASGTVTDPVLAINTS